MATKLIDKKIFREGYMKGYMDGAQKYNNEFSDVYIIDNILLTLKGDSEKLANVNGSRQQAASQIVMYIKNLSKRLEDYKNVLFTQKTETHKKYHSSKEKKER